MDQNTFTADEQASGGAAMLNEDQRARVSAFASTLVAKRKHAMEHRAASGIETTWQEDDDHYDGIDDANRAIEASKPSTSAGRVLYGPTEDGKPGATQSKVFVNITQPYVDMASARLADMLLPTDDRPFGMAPTPMPDMLDAKKTSGADVLTMPDGKQMAVAEAVTMMLDEAKARAEKAESRIWDWLVESNWHAEARVMIEDAAKIGTGVMKGPFPAMFKKRSVTRLPDGTTKIVMVQETKPKSKAISVWNLYPDPACGDDIHNGAYIWEKDQISAKTLKQLKETRDAQGRPVYIDFEIDAIIKEGPGKKYANNLNATESSDRDMFEIWYFCGMATAEDLRAGGCECEDGDMVPVEVTMVNDRVIKIAQSPLDSGEFPYDVFRWQRKRGHWAGIGVSRQIRTPQRIVNAATRNMMDNAGLAAGGIFVIRSKGLSPANGQWEIAPRKVFTVDDDADVQDARAFLNFIEIPMQQEKLQAIINYGMQLAERVTSMPLLMMGMQGDSTKTLGGMQLLNNNGSVVLRRHAKIFDDDIIERHIPRYYEWLLLWGNEEGEKGDLTIDARGSSALFERDAQNQAMQQMGALVGNPAFGIDPKKWIAEMMKGQRLDPKRFQYSEEEQQRMAEAAQQQPADPRIEVAGMRRDVDIERLRADREEAQAARQHDREMREMDLKIKILDMANAKNMSIDQIKAALARDAMKLRTQKELATQKVGPVAQVATPPTEPAGRAAPGMAFQQ